MRKIFSLVLIFALILGAVTITAEGAQTYADFEYFSDGNGITIVRYTGAGGDVVIPAEIDGKPVSVIGEAAFARCDKITSINIPSTVINIGEFAFSSCDRIKSITIPEGVVSIGADAFYCSLDLTEVIIPDSVTSIGLAAFISCKNLTVVRLSNNLKSISEDMFLGCEKLSQITIPDSVTVIGGQAFAFCDSLTSIELSKNVERVDQSFDSCKNLTQINVDKENPFLCSVDGVLFSKDMKPFTNTPANEPENIIYPSVSL